MGRYSWNGVHSRRTLGGMAAATVLLMLAAIVFPAAAFAVAETEPNGTFATANTAAFGSNTGTISPSNDLDYFRITATSGVQLVITVTGGTLSQPDLYLYGSSQNEISHDHGDSEAPAQITYTPGSTGTLYMRVSSRTSGTGTYTLRINRAPSAVADSYNTNEDTQLTVAAPGVLANDADPDGDSLTADLQNSVQHGTLSLNANGSFTYTPNANWSGYDHFHYRVYDGQTYSGDVVVGLNVAPVNDAPVAVADSRTTAEDTQLNVSSPGVLANDTDVDGDALTAVLVTDVSHGTLTLRANGSYTYTPAANYNGSDSFTYHAYDGSLYSNTVTVSLTITAVNDLPVCVNDTATCTEDGFVSVDAPGVLGNDPADVEGSLVTAHVFTQPSHGVVVMQLDGSYIYTPDPDFFGTDTFTYRGFDGTGYSTVPGLVSIDVIGTPDAPVSAPDAYTTNEDTTLNVAAAGVLSNDVNVDRDTLKALLITDVQHGVLTFHDDGSFTYVPDANWFGTDTFEYNPYNTSNLHGVTVAVTIDVTSVNDLPVATADAYSTAEDTQLTIDAPGVLANDSDPVEGSPLTAHLVANVSHGTLALHADGSFVYTPAADYNGEDSFTYRAHDGEDYSNTVTVTLTVDPVADAPIAANDAATTAEDTALHVAASGVLSNDSDADGDPITAVLVDTASHGTLTLNADGSYDYVPYADFHGTDTFTYKAFDGALYSDSATVTITVTSVYDPPVAVEDTYSTNEDTTLNISAAGLLSNDLGDGPLTVSAWHDSVAGTHGTVTCWPDGRMRYVPRANFNGTDTFVYRITDGVNRSAYVTVTINVWPVNDAPVATADSATTAEDTPLVVDAPGVLANDTDIDGDPLTAVLVDDVSHGSLALLADGSYSYTPAANYNGEDSFTYKAFDGTDYSDTVTVSLTVTAVNDAPVAVDDTASVAQDGTLHVAAPGVLANDTDVEGDALTAALVTGVSDGDLTLHADGSYDYTPNAGFSGSDSFKYKANDGALDSDTAVVTITVVPTQVTVDFVTDGTTGATITGTPSQSVVPGADCTEVTAQAPAGYHFVRWTGTGGFITTTTNPLTVTNVPGAMTITAEFAIDTHTLTYTAGAHGHITGTSPQSVNHGGSGTEVTAVADPHFHFVGWSDLGTSATRTDSGVTHDINVTANFAVDGIPVWRFYNSRTATHFYTADTAERDRVIATMGGTYHYEGLAYQVSANGPVDGTPLYRFFNLKNGSHFYTADAAEKDRLRATMTSVYSYDGVAYYVSTSTSDRPVFRFFNLKNGAHFYTASVEEKNSVIATFGSIYSLDGVGFYVMP